MPEAAFAGPNGSRLNKLLKFPDGYTYAVAIALGIPSGTKEAHPFEPCRVDFID
jgi:hypothetical protein